MKGIIFDLDGTMVDNMMVHHRAWQQLLREQGIDLSIEEVIEKVHGVNEEILERLFGDRFTPEERKSLSYEKEARYRQIFKSELKLNEGLNDFLEKCKAKDIPLGVATAAPKENLDFVLDNLNIRHFFEATFHSGDVSKGKPDPEVFLKTAEALQVDPTHCVIFEDSPTGAKAAANAGAKLVVVTNTHAKEDFEYLPVSRFIENFAALELEDLTIEDKI